MRQRSDGVTVLLGMPEFVVGAQLEVEFPRFSGQTECGEALSLRGYPRLGCSERSARTR
jgi:hypothetical protein